MEVIKRLGDKVFACDVSASVAGAHRRRHDHICPKASMRGLLGVIRVVLAVDRSLPVYPDEQTFSASEGMSQTGHKATFAASLNHLVGASK
jgi:hypothetical protein